MPPYAFLIALSIFGLWLASRGAQAATPSPDTPPRAELRELRWKTVRVRQNKCWHNNYLPFNRGIREIPLRAVPQLMEHWLLRLQRARAKPDRCETIPAWPWLALASCESGQDWDYNGPSGFDGGLQFLPSTWTTAKAAVPRAYGYSYAWQAPAYVQYLVARSWLARTSWAQWPACSAALGLR